MDDPTSPKNDTRRLSTESTDSADSSGSSGSAAANDERVGVLPKKKKKKARYFKGGKYKIGKNGGAYGGKKTMARAPKSAW